MTELYANVTVNTNRSWPKSGLPPADDEKKKEKVQVVPGKTYFGAWTGNASLDSFAGLVGMGPKIVMHFEQMSDTWEYNPFPMSFAKKMAWQNRISLITWEPSGLEFDVNDKSGAYLDEFNKQLSQKKGVLYEYALQWAKSAASFGKPFFLRPFHEMNFRERYPWTAWMNGGGTDVASILEARDNKGNYHVLPQADMTKGNGIPDGIERTIAAWINLYNLFQDAKAYNATFVWCPNETGYPTETWNNIPAYYPGSGYVDWVGVDGYRKTDTENFSVIFKTALAFLKTTGKPIMIAETSSIPDSGKAGYMQQLSAALTSTNVRINAVVLFSEDKAALGGGEENWAANAPVKGRSQSISDSQMAKYEQLKRDYGDNPAKLKMMMDAFGIPDPETATSISSGVNTGLIGVRNFVTNNVLLGFKTPITINTPGTNESQVVLKVSIEVQKIIAEQIKRIAGIKAALIKNSAGKVIMDLKSNRQLMFELGREYVKLWDVAPFDDPNKAKYLQAALEYLTMVKKESPFYIQSRAELKEVYMRLADLCPDKERDGYLVIASGYADEMLTLMGDRTFYSARQTHLTESQRLGYMVSAYATLANVEVSRSKPNKKNAQDFFEKAQGIINGGRLNETFMNNLWTEGIFQVIKAARKDLQKDLKVTIRIGQAKMKCLDTEDVASLDQGVKELSGIAFDTTISPRLKLKAKMELIRALAKYSTVARKLQEKFWAMKLADRKEHFEEYRRQYEGYINQAKKALVLCDQLSATEFSYSAGETKDSLAGIGKPFMLSRR